MQCGAVHLIAGVVPPGTDPEAAKATYPNLRSWGVVFAILRELVRV
jgi:hypothetical protein